MNQPKQTMLLVRAANFRFRVRVYQHAFAFFIFLLFFSVPSSGQSQEPEDNSCVTCHSDLWEGMKSSVHSQHGVFCQDCHGGDPTQLDFDLAKAPETGFIGIPDKKKIVNQCGTCHSDVEKMNPYGLRTDQLARYQTSVHGKKLLIGGDSHVAACTDCHGHHDVLPISDPNSPVYPLNIPNTCNRCHGDKKLMDQYQLPSDIFETYRSSVHGQALFEKKDLSVANCVSCHGSHGAVPPGVKEIGAVCGKCHINESKYFLESVHAGPMRQGKFSECISCHGNHGVQPASPDLYQKSCLQCHDAQSTAFQQGHRLQEMFHESSQAFETARSEVKDASIHGIFVEEESSLLEEARSGMIEMAPAQHTLSLASISELESKVISLAEKVKGEIQRKRQNLKWRKLALIPLWIFVLVMVLALRAKYHELKGKK
jgi:hypothetical protein